MGFGCIVAGLIFFFNPSINVIDLLPDFIGCLLIIVGLSKLSYLSPALNDAKSGFTKMFAVYLGKLVSMFILIPVPEKEYVWKLIFVFVFAVFEAIFLFRAFDDLYNGVSYLSTKHDHKAFYRDLSNVRSITYVFLGARLVLNLLPELTYLFSEENSGMVTAWQTGESTQYYGILMLVNLFFTTILGIVFLSMALPYFSRLKKNQDIQSGLKAYYNEHIASNEGLMLVQKLKAPVYLLIGAFFFLPSLPFTGVNILPDFAFFLLILLASFPLVSVTEAAKPLRILSAVGTAVSALYFAFSLYYALEFHYANIVKVTEAYSAFVPVAITAVINALLIACVIVFLWKLIGKLIDAHTGLDTDDEQKQRFDGTREALHAMNRSFLLSGIGASLSHALMPGVVCATKSTLLLKISQYHFVDIALSLLCLFFAYRVISALFDKIRYKYL